MESLLLSPTHPKECLLGIALPMSREAFLRDISLGEQRDFARHVVRALGFDDGPTAWQKGYGAVVQSLSGIFQEVQAAGVRVQTGFSLADLRGLSGEKIVTVFAHMARSGDVELADGLHAPRVFAEAIPGNFSGIFDLTVCHSSQLLDSLKEVTKSRCLGVSNAAPATLQLRAILYQFLIRLLQKEPLNYVDAYSKIRLMLNKP